MKLIKTFKDLQNEVCEVYVDNIGNFYIGRRSSTKMNLNLDKVEELLLICKQNNIKEWNK
jgi:hypothetical protein